MVLAFLAIAVTVFAEVKLPKIFGNNMVLQQNSVIMTSLQQWCQC